ncbi:S8 family serine peptidase [Micromonospora sp. NPDC047074]|uniref:S8 family serine peptidase n=1 Tax=Micromonospora sp. NPDC047074 TaxID=3154339 RepID=UPI0033C4FC2C
MGPRPDRPAQPAAQPVLHLRGRHRRAHLRDRHRGARQPPGLRGRASHGYDAVDNDYNADDGNGHGTFVASVAAGNAYGVAKNASIVGVRVLDNNGSGTTAGVVAGIDRVTATAVRPAVANLSLGGGVCPPPARRPPGSARR